MDALRFRFLVFAGLLGAILALGTAGVMITEGLSMGEAFYFSVVTVTTVGYGDIHPNTQAGRALAVFLIIGGVGTFMGAVANATEALMNRRDHRMRQEKMHMVTGLFFSEAGTGLLRRFADLDPGIGADRAEFLVTDAWTEDEFDRLGERLATYPFEVGIRPGSLGDIRRFLDEKGTLLLRLLENPSLLEHEDCTELLRAVFHLREELLHRDDPEALPASDRAHLAGDVKRAYALLARNWLVYLRYLKESYPYLFSLALRTNPFNREASVVVV